MKHSYKYAWTYKGKTVVECETCGYKHLHPKPTIEQLNDFYIKQYHTQIKNVNYSAMDDNYIKSMEQILENDFIYNMTFSNVSKNLKTENRNMLDLGCGNNLTSVLFNKNGWNSYVVEPSEDAYNYILRYGVRGYNCFFEHIDSDELPKMAFINVQYVLEHVINPVELITKAYSLLETGGILRIVTPNDFSDAHLAYMEYFKKDASWICYPDHINYFNRKSLEKIINKYDLEIVCQMTNFPLEMLLLCGLDFYNDNDAKEKVSGIISNFNNTFISTQRSSILQSFYESIANAGFGRILDIYARKT